MSIPFTGPLSVGRRARQTVRPSTKGNSSARVSTRVRGLRGWTPLSIGLLLLIGVLASVGLVFVASSSSIYALHRFGSPWYLFQKQAIFVGIGTVALLFAILIPYRVWRVLGPMVLFGSMMGVAMTYTSIGVSRNGSSRWIGPESLQIQPSELVKFGLAATLALGLSAIEGHRDEQRKIRNQMFLALGVVVVPIFAQPDMGTAMILVAIIASLIVVTGLPMRALGFYAAGGFAITVILSLAAPYRRDRILAFLHPDRDPNGIGYHVMQSKMGFASGRLFGSGIGASKAKWGFLPNSYTDFIYAVIGEELGLVGATLVLAAFLIIATIGTRIARRTDDRFAALFAIGITTWIVSQAVMNMGAVIGTMPVTGVPLPFISKGGSSFVVLMSAAGVLINIARHTRAIEKFGAPRVRRGSTVTNDTANGAANHSAATASGVHV